MALQFVRLVLELSPDNPVARTALIDAWVAGGRRAETFAPAYGAAVERGWVRTVPALSAIEVTRSGRGALRLGDRIG